MSALLQQHERWAVHVPAKVDVPWTDEQVAYLREHWKAGDSAAMIGKAIGRTRNSVCAKLDRLKLLRTRETPEANRERPHLKQIARSKVSGVKLYPTPLPGNTRVLQGPAWDPLPGTTPVAMMDLEPGMCKWPIRDGKPYLFCGCPSNAQYCEYHSTVAYRSVQC
jgi:GcrA cell cycle regulator